MIGEPYDGTADDHCVGCDRLVWGDEADAGVCRACVLDADIEGENPADAYAYYMSL